MATRNDTPVRSIKFTGLQDAKSAHAVGRDGLLIADNVDISNDLEVERRPGRTKIRSGAVDAVWGDGGDLLFASANDLLRLESDASEVILTSGLTSSSILAVARVGNRLFWSNSYETGVVEGNGNRSLGLPTPSRPAVTVVGGALPTGTYVFALSLLRSDKQESGCSLETLATLSERGGFSIAVPASSTDTNVTHVNVYVSAPEGRQLYLLATVKLGASAVVFDDSVRRLGVVTPPFVYSGALPAFQCADICDARLVVGSGEVLYFSHPFAYEVFDLRHNYIPFYAQVEAIASVDGGTFIGTSEQVLYLRKSIADPSEVLVVADYGVVSNSSVLRFESHEIQIQDFSGKGAIMLTKRGYALCLDGGGFINVTEGEVIFPSTPVSGNSVLRRNNGTVHALSVVMS